MPKHDSLAPKAIANRTKSVGLQKLRWYCQMCQKQCRDENGFKCHTTSEGHLRQMRLFAENPHHLIDDFSREFERGYMETLSHRHGSKRVLANRVYQEYIADKHHIHMNATMWTSLTELCKYLGREGKAVVDETEKGWFITYIDRDPKLLAKQAAADQRKVQELDDEERTRRVIDAQIAAAGGSNGLDDDEDDDADDNMELQREDGAGRIEVSFAAKKRPLKTVIAPLGSTSSVFTSTELKSSNSAALNASRTAFGNHDDEPPAKKSFTSSSSSAQPMSAIEQLMRDEERRKQNLAKQQVQRLDVSSVDSLQDVRKDYWLVPGIVVKCMSKKLADGKYYKKKGAVINVHDKFLAEVKMEDGGARIRIDQDELETVIPKVGRPCFILNGRGRGSRATLLRINEEKFNCDVTLTDGREVSGIEYEDLSKLAEE